MVKRYALVAEAFVYEDWCDLQAVVGDAFIIGEPRPGNKEIVIGYESPLGRFSGNIGVAGLEEQLYKFAVKRGAVELDWPGSFIIDWSKMPGPETGELLVELLGFRPEFFDMDFIANPDKETIGL